MAARFGVLLADGNPALLEECTQDGEIDECGWRVADP